MPRKPKGAVMNEEEMGMEVRKQRGSGLYQGRESTMQANRERVGQIVGMALAELTASLDASKKIPLSQTADIEEAILKYMKVCAENGVIPTMAGLAAVIGYTREGLYAFVRNHPDHPSADLLRRYSDLCSEALARAALDGSTSAIPSIFVLKSRHGWQDTVAETMPEPDQHTMDAKEIMERYGDLPD